MRTEAWCAGDAVRLFDERHARGWMDAWPSDKIERVVGMVAALRLPDQARILDFGCGAGVFAGAMKAAFPEAEVEGRDVSTEAIARARRLCPQIRFEVAGGSGRDLPSNRYDLVYTHHVLEYVADLDGISGALARALKPGGKLLHIVPCGNAGSLEHRISLLTSNGVGEAGRFCIDDPSHVRRLTSEELTGACRSQGLVPVEALFANQFWGGVEYLTGEYYRTLAGWLNPAGAASRAAAVEMAFASAVLLPLCMARTAPRLVLAGAGRPRRNVGKAAFRLLVPLARWAQPVCGLVDRAIRLAARREWRTCSHLPWGSEMYLLFEKR